MYWKCFQRFLESLTYALIFNLDFAENFVSGSSSSIYYPGQLQNPALEEYQKVRYLKWCILVKKVSFFSEISVKHRSMSRALQTCAWVEIAHRA